MGIGVGYMGSILSMEDWLHGIYIINKGSVTWEYKIYL